MLDAVLTIGFAKVTIPLVAKHLGVSVATIYRHVPDRPTMLADAWDRVVDRISWPDPQGEWRPLVLAYADAFWRALAEHPGVVSALSTGLVPDRTVDLLLRLVVHVHRQGFAMDDAVLLVDTVFDTVVDHRLGVERLDGHTPQLAVSRDEMARSWKPSPGEPEEIGLARAAMRDAITIEPRAWLRRKLDLILDGAAPRRYGAQ